MKLKQFFLSADFIFFESIFKYFNAKKNKLTLILM